MKVFKVSGSLDSHINVVKIEAALDQARSVESVTISTEALMILDDIVAEAFDQNLEDETIPPHAVSEIANLLEFLHD